MQQFLYWVNRPLLKRKSAFKSGVFFIGKYQDFKGIDSDQ